MTDRVIVYDGALPQTVDVLLTNKFMMVGQGFQNQAILGANTVVAGLACAPTVPASLQVTVGTGSIYQQDPTDAAAYGDLGTDNINIVKQGILNVAQNLTLTPPATTGFSIVYLVQAILNDIDAGATVLSYFNAANPNQPFSGPANSGISQFTQRTCACVVALKAGIPATTGTQVTPTPDAGFVGLYAITVANGATTIVSGNIAQLPSAPYFPTLPSVPLNVLDGSWIYAGTDTGVANAYAITFVAGQAIPTAYVAGMGVKFVAQHSCSAASTVNVNGLGAVSIRRATGAGVTTGDIVSGQMMHLTYDGTNFQMTNYLGSGTNTNTQTQVGIPYVADSGAQNALVGAYSPAITSGQQVAGLTLAIKLANTITGGCTINVNGLGTKAVTLGDSTNPPFNIFTAGMVLLLEYDGTRYQIVNTSAGMFYKQPTANYTIYVNGSTGSDTLYDGTAATVGTGTSGPFATISKAVISAWGYAPSQFTITIQVAAGTYNEAVLTPLFAGPNVIINGAGSTATIVNSTSNTFTCRGPNTLTVQNVNGTNTGNANNWVFGATNGGTLTTLATQSGNQAGSVFVAEGSGANVFPGTHSFNGSGWTAFAAIFGGTVTINTFTFSILGPISFASAFAATYAAGVIAVNNQTPPTFTNPSFVAGQKFSNQFNGVTATDGLGVNFFPGSSAGINNTGGQYS